MRGWWGVTSRCKLGLVWVRWFVCVDCFWVAFSVFCCVGAC